MAMRSERPDSPLVLSRERVVRGILRGGCCGGACANDLRMGVSGGGVPFSPAWSFARCAFHHHLQKESSHACRHSTTHALTAIVLMSMRACPCTQSTHTQYDWAGWIGSGCGFISESFGITRGSHILGSVDAITNARICETYP